MNLTLAVVGHRGKSQWIDPAVMGYLTRLRAHAKIDSVALRTESALFDLVERQKSRSTPRLVLLDERGATFSSEEFARWLQSSLDSGIQGMVFAVGPANGWSPEARAKAHKLLSLGKMTLPHDLARLVIAEQLYRAFTILVGHPYHLGH